MQHQQPKLDELYAARHSKCVVGDDALLTDITSLHSDWTATLLLLGKLWVIEKLLFH